MKPFIIVCGMPKLGKSFECAKAFQNSLTILSSASNQHYYRKMLNTKLKEPITRVVAGKEVTFNYKPPKRIKLIDTHSTNVPTETEPYSWDIKPKVILGKNIDGQLVADPNGTIMMPTDTIMQLENTVMAVVSKSLSAASKGEPPPYDNVIIDEWGEFMDRVYAQITPTVLTKSGAENGMKAYGIMNDWVGKFLNWLKQLQSCNVGVALVCHDREPAGEGKKGGAKAPSSGIAMRMTGMADGAVQRIIKDPEYGAKNPDGTPQKPKRLWRATASEQWAVGLRGIEPEDEDAIAEKELYDILVEYAGFDM